MHLSECSQLLQKKKRTLITLMLSIKAFDQHSRQQQCLILCCFSKCQLRTKKPTSLSRVWHLPYLGRHDVLNFLVGCRMCSRKVGVAAAHYPGLQQLRTHGGSRCASIRVVARVREGRGAACAPPGTDMSTERGSESLTALEKKLKRDRIDSGMETNQIRSWDQGFLIKRLGEAREAMFWGQVDRGQGSGEGSGTLETLCLI